MICEMLTVIPLREGVWLRNIDCNLGNRWGANIDSQEQQMRPDLQDWLRSD